MLYFIDESGDFTTDKTTDKNFILAAVITHTYKPVQVVLKRARKTLPPKLKEFGEIKGGRAPKKYKQKIFNEIRKAKDIELAVCIFKPNTIPKRLQKKEGVVYSLLLRKFLERMGIKNQSMADIICDDRSLPGTSREGIRLLLQTEFLGERTSLKKLEIDFKDSASNAGLQIVHWVAWAFYQKYQRKDGQWVKILGEKEEKLKTSSTLVFRQ